MAEEIPSADLPVTQQTERPVFERNQVLLAEQLNGVAEHLDAQVRATRLYAQGTGIVEGLDIRWRPAGDEEPAGVELTAGAAITSVGHLIVVPETRRLTHRRRYRGDARPDEAPLPPALAALEDDLWLLGGAEADAEPVGPWLSAGRRRRGLVVLLLERAEYEISPCEAVANCRDQGRRVVWTLRPLFVDLSGEDPDSLGLPASTPSGPAPIVMSAARLDARLEPAAGESGLRADPEDALRGLFAAPARAALGELRQGLGDLDAFAAHVDADGTLSGISDRLVNIEDRLQTAGLDLDATLSTYDFAVDLVRTHAALVELGRAVQRLARPAAERFPQHVSLGAVDPPDIDDPDARRAQRMGRRHHFRPAGDWGRGAIARRAWIELRDRLRAMIERFDPTHRPDLRARLRRRPDGFEVLPQTLDGRAWPATVSDRPWYLPPLGDVRHAPPDARLLADARDVFIEGARGLPADVVEAAVRRAVEARWPQAITIRRIELERPHFALPPAQVEGYRHARRRLLTVAHQIWLLLGGAPPLIREPALAAVAARQETLAEALRGLIDALPLDPTRPEGDGDTPRQRAVDAWLALLTEAAELAWRARLGDFGLGPNGKGAAWLPSGAGRYHAFVGGWLAELRARLQALFAIDAQPLFDALTAAEREAGLAGYVRRHPALTHLAGVPLGGTLVLVTRGGEVVADLMRAGCCDPIPPARALPAFAIFVEATVDTPLEIFDFDLVPGLAAADGWDLIADESPQLKVEDEVESIVGKAFEALAGARLPDAVKARIEGALTASKSELLGHKGRPLGWRNPVFDERLPLPGGGAPAEPSEAPAPLVDGANRLYFEPTAAGLHRFDLRLEVDGALRATLHVWVAVRPRPLFATDDRMHTVRRAADDDAPTRRVTLPVDPVVALDDDIEATLVTQPLMGQVQVEPDGLTYTPDPGAVGDDTFVYRLAPRGGDGSEQALARVSVHIADCCEPVDEPDEPDEPVDPRIWLVRDVFLATDTTAYPVKTRGAIARVVGPGISPRFTQATNVKSAALADPFARWRARAVDPVAMRVGGDAPLARVDQPDGRAVDVGAARVDVADELIAGVGDGALADRVGGIAERADAMAGALDDDLFDLGLIDRWHAERLKPSRIVDGWQFTPANVDVPDDRRSTTVELRYSWAVDDGERSRTYPVRVWRPPAAQLTVAVEHDGLRIAHPPAARADGYRYSWSIATNTLEEHSRWRALNGQGPEVHITADDLEGLLDKWTPGDTGRALDAVAGRPVEPGFRFRHLRVRAAISIEGLEHLDPTIAERTIDIAGDRRRLPKYNWAEVERRLERVGDRLRPDDRALLAEKSTDLRGGGVLPGDEKSMGLLGALARSERTRSPVADPTLVDAVGAWLADFHRAGTTPDDRQIRQFEAAVQSKHFGRTQVYTLREDFAAAGAEPALLGLIDGLR